MVRDFYRDFYRDFQSGINEERMPKKIYIFFIFVFLFLVHPYIYHPPVRSFIVLVDFTRSRFC